MNRKFVVVLFIMEFIMFFIGFQIGRFDTCERIYKSEGMPDVTYKDGVLLWHPWEIVPESEIYKYR
jgi:hypothetical protein